MALADFLYDPWTIGVGTALIAAAATGAFVWGRKRIKREGSPPPASPTATRHAPQRADGGGHVTIQGNIGGNFTYQGFPPVPGGAPPPAASQPRVDPPRDFTGRRKELDAIEGAFAKAQGVAIQGVRGKGGVGKTALALAAAQRLRQQFADGQHVVELRGSRANPATPEEAMESVLLALDPQAPTKDMAPARLRAHYRMVLGARRMLLILDDAANAAQVEPLLPPVPCGAIVTSRVAFHIAGMETLPLDVLDPLDARRLLHSLCPRLADKEADAVAEKCGRLPLALRIAGTTLNTYRDLEVDEYLQSLKEGKERLHRLKVEDDPNLDVEVCFQYSYDKLPADLQARWRELGVFQTTFPLPAAAGVWNLPQEDSKDALRRLVARSLVEYDEDLRRYLLHDLLRDFAQTRLQKNELREARLRHARYYLQLAGAADDFYLKGAEYVLQGLRLFDAEWENIREAQRWSAQQPPNDREVAALVNEFPNSAAYCLALRLHASERIEWLQAASRAALSLGDKHREGTHVGNLGLAYQALGRPREAIQYHMRALKISREVGDKKGEASDLGNLGLAYAAVTEVRTAIEYYEQALAISRAIGDRRGEGGHLGNLGLAYAMLGRDAQAVEYYERALEISREVGDRRAEGNSLGNLGNVYARLSKPEKAIEYYEQALAISREIGDRQGEANRLGNLGLAYARLHETHKAIEYDEQALVISREIGDRRGEGNHLGNIGSAYAALGETRKAIEHYGQALAISRDVGDRRGQASHLGNLSVAYEFLGDVIQALELHEQALHIFVEIESPDAERARAAIARLRRKLQQ